MRLKTQKISKPNAIKAKIKGARNTLGFSITKLDAVYSKIIPVFILSL
jgi:hypothetical protein